MRIVGGSGADAVFFLKYVKRVGGKKEVEVDKSDSDSSSRLK